MRLTEAQAKILLGARYIPAIKPDTPSSKRARQNKQPSEGESVMALHLRTASIPFVMEFKFCPSRKWRSDFHISNSRVLIEVEGGTWSGGRHTRGKGYQNDCEKYSWAAAHGWVVLRFTTAQVKSGLAIEHIKTALRT
jgi:very-short-patch-repair endonuclease